MKTTQWHDFLIPASYFRSYQEAKLAYGIINDARTKITVCIIDYGLRKVTENYFEIRINDPEAEKVKALLDNIFDKEFWQICSLTKQQFLAHLSDDEREKLRKVDFKY